MSKIPIIPVEVVPEGIRITFKVGSQSENKMNMKYKQYSNGGEKWNL